MSDDLTKKLPQSADDKLTLVLSRLDGLEQKVDERLYDARPIWQKVVADIGQLQEGQQRLEQGQVALRTEVRSMSKDINHRLDVLNKTMLGIQAGQLDIDERVRTLENTHNPPNSQT
jgi:hypothetical protein